MPTVDRIERVARQIVRDLRSMQDPARARQTRRYFKHSVAALGIGASTLRKYRSEQLTGLSSEWTLADAVQLCDRLLHEPEVEIRLLAPLLLYDFRSEFTVSLLPTARRWLETRFDNWALVDAFSGYVVGPLLERDPAVEQSLRRWSRHRSLWVRRASLVTLVPLVRQGRYLDLAYELAGEHFSDREDLMHKATGWLLREAGKTDAPRLRRFLLENGPRLPRTALRYAIERFPADERTRLLTATRRVAQATTT